MIATTFMKLKRLWPEPQRRYHLLSFLQNYTVWVDFGFASFNSTSQSHCDCSQWQFNFKSTPGPTAQASAPRPHTHLHCNVTVCSLHSACFLHFAFQLTVTTVSVTQSMQSQKYQDGEAAIIAILGFMALPAVDLAGHLVPCPLRNLPLRTTKNNRPTSSYHLYLPVCTTSTYHFVDYHFVNYPFFKCFMSRDGVH